MLRLKEGTIFVADAHFPHHGEEFSALLKALHSGGIDTPMLVLMGDIFDLLFGYNDYILGFYEDTISRLDELSRKIPIVYLEGNHDFCLKEIFADMEVIARERQPLEALYAESKIMLSHGDLYETGLAYELYTHILRRRSTLRILRPFQKSIIDAVMKRLAGKKICPQKENFETRARKILSHYPADTTVVEGHHHMGIALGRYISLPSLACDRKVALLREGKMEFLDIDSLL